METSSAIQVSDCPEDFYGRTKGHLRCDVLNRRLTRWLLERENGVGRPSASPSSVRFIPHSPEEVAAWKTRRPQSGKRPPTYVTFDSAAAAYAGRPRGRKRFAQQTKGAPATTPSETQVTQAGEGEAATYTSAPARRPDVGAQAEVSKSTDGSPSGAPAHRARPKRKMRRKTGFDLQNLDRIIARSLGIA